MAITPLTVTIDLNPSYKKIPAVYVSQLDNNLRSLAITVKDGGVNYDVASSGYDVYIEGTKPDYKGFSYEVTEIGGTIVGSVITVPMQTQMTCVQGMVPTEIVLKSGTNRIGSANFLLVVERAGLAEDVDLSETDIPAYIDSVDDLKSALQTYPNIMWTVGAEVRASDGVQVVNTYNACSNHVYCNKHSIIVNNSQLKDSNNKTLVTSIALYKGGMFVRRDPIAYGATYTVADDITSVRLNIGRYSSSGVTFAEADIALFGFTFFINPKAESVDTFTSLPPRAMSKFRYVWHDNFHRANSADLGTYGNGDSIHPMSYSYAGAQLAISNDMCVNTAAAKGQAFADMHVSDCIIEFEADLTETALGTRGAGILFRRTGPGDFLYCQMRQQTIKFGKFVEGTMTELKSIGVTSPTSAPIKVSVILRGNRITVCTNGVEVATLYDDFNVTATVHGLLIDNYTANNNPIIRNFGVKVPTEWQPMVDQMDAGALPYNIATENAGQAYNFAIQNSVVCNSNTALRFENRKTDNYKRSEIAVKGYGQMLDEQWYEWDMYLGSDYSVTDSMSEIIMQMHDITDDNQSVATQPSFGIFVKDGEYYVHSQYSPYHSTYDTSHIVVTDTKIGDYLNDLEKWVHWSLRIKWAYNDFFEPLIELYKNGELVYKSTKPNVINAAAVPYFKIGIYTYAWVESPDSVTATVRTMYVDNIKPSY